MTELVLLSIVQGITEFLPISSSAHLILVSDLFNLSNSNLTLDISLHLGSLLAVILHFKKDLKKFLKDRDLLIKIIITSIPITIVGFLLVNFNYVESIRNYKTIGWSTIIFGLLLFLSDQFDKNNSINKNFSYNKIIFISLFQIFSLIPGASRAGIIITSARLLRFNIIDAAKISFLTSIPILILVSIYNIQKIILQNNLEISSINFFGILLSFIFSYITLKLFVSFIKKFNLIIFIIYRIILGIIILTYVYN